MIHSVSPIALVVFVVFVAATLGLSFYLGRRAGSAQGYFAAHGQIPWFINGVAFAGDYLSAASFLGICGMIAFSGYDGFLYSIGYLAGWIVALFVIAEPIKRRGKFTFADCLDSTFNSRGIRLAAGLSTLVVSTFYLIPQMVGAGVLIQPLLGLPHWAGVLIVGAVVILIVTTAGMVSTTWVQFLKGALLVLFSLLLTSAVLSRGISVSNRSSDGHDFLRVGPFTTEQIESRDWQVQLSDTEICSIDPNLLSLYRQKSAPTSECERRTEGLQIGKTVSRTLPPRGAERHRSGGWKATGKRTATRPRGGTRAVASRWRRFAAPRRPSGNRQARPPRIYSRLLRNRNHPLA